METLLRLCLLRRGTYFVTTMATCSVKRKKPYLQWLTETDWDKFIQHNMTLYRCMISDIHDSSYVLFSTNLISNTSLHVGRPLLRPCLVAYAEATLARQKDSATNEKCWHHFRIFIVDKWSVVWNEGKNREFLLTGWKSLWSLATWLVISDRYIGEVILQLSIEAMASHSNSTKPLPQLRTEYILLITSSSTTHYVCVVDDDEKQAATFRVTASSINVLSLQ